jgi:hypothetical protein
MNREMNFTIATNSDTNDDDETVNIVLAVSTEDTQQDEDANPQSFSCVSSSLSLLHQLEQKRVQWESGLFHRTSNQHLYAVLADCLDYGQMNDSSAFCKHRNDEVRDFLKSRDYRVKNDSPLLTRVVKAVFGNIDRRRISTYSLVLRTAQKEGVKPAELANWIEERGGVQEVKLARSATYKSPKQKAEEAKSSLSALPTLAVAKEKLAELADAEFVGSECVLLAEQQADGSFHIKALIRSCTAVNAALTALYGEQKKTAT